MTKVAILWHMHQPFYQDLVTGEHILPWVRLHGLKDYYGMVALLREFPTVRVTFNLVPSLVVQLEAFAEDRARDRSLELSLKPAAELTDEDKRFILANFFHAQRARMIETAPRYAELLRRRDRANANGGAVRGFSEADFRDLQVWHKLAWVDPFFIESDARVSALVAKGRGYNEDDKRVLREVELVVAASRVPEYRSAAARGQVELSASPFYHPILPLLCDTDIYLRTHPQSRMPRQRFRHPDDARAQLEKAVQSHQRTFGVKPVGLWPSEGSVSDAIVPLAAAAGFQWMATDELILARTLGVGPGARRLRAPRAAGDAVPAIHRARRRRRDRVPVPRPRALGSDRVHLRQLGARRKPHRTSWAGWWKPAGATPARTGGGEAVIPVILDGENAWEHFEGQGRPFLRALYRALATHPEIKTVTMSEAAQCAGHAAERRVPGVVDQRRLLHLDRASRRPPRLGAAGGRPPGDGCAGRGGHGRRPGPCP